MARPIWITRSTTLSTINEAEYFELQLEADNAVSFTKIAGELPRGLQISSGGLIQGLASVPQGQGEQIYSYNFTVRATSSDNLIADRSFVLAVTNIRVPVIVGPNSNLGSFQEGDYVNIQLEYGDFSSGETVTFTIVDGTLPNSNITSDNEIFPYTLKLSSTGLLSGYILKQPLATQTYNFVVEISDGYSSTRQGFSLIATQSAVSPVPPLLLTLASEIQPTKHDNFYSFKFVGYDFNDDEIEFFIDNNISDSSISGERGFDSTGFDRFGFDQIIGSLSGSLALDSATGWLYGNLIEVQGTETFVFSVGVRKTVAPFTSSKNRVFSLRVFSESDQKVNWITPSDLGEIYNGAVSELFVKAVNAFDSELPVFYRLKPYDPADPSPIKIPQGLLLKENGLLIGRSSFRYFSLDNGSIQFDNNTTFFDETNVFTVEAIDANDNILGSRIFSVRVISRNQKPYENISLKSMNEPLIRSQYFDLIQSQDWIIDENVYRPTDPFFGRVSNLQILFLPGIEPELLTEYVTTTELNHYRKKVNLSDLKLARALDDNFNVIYEVIYADVDDSLESNGQSVALEIDLLNKLANYYQIDGIDQKIVYPNSFQNMRKRLLDELNLETKGVLPRWMISVQEDGGVLGFIRAVPLVYCNPGTGKIALQSLQNKITDSTNSGFINEFNFEIDRYSIDLHLSRYYNPVTEQFLSDTETTFDRFIDSGTFLNFGGFIDYAVDVPFETINNANLFQLRGSSDIVILSPETYDVQFNGNFDNSVAPWSTWMNEHAVWTDTGIASGKNTGWTMEREFGVTSAGVYKMAVMNTNTTKISINQALATEITGFNVTSNFENYIVDVYLISGINTIKTVMTIPDSGSTLWTLNPNGLSIVIYRIIEVNDLPVTEIVFDTKIFKDPKIGFNTITFQPGIDGEVDIKTGQKLIFATQDYYEDYPGLEFDNHGWNNYVELYGVDYDSEDFNEYSVIPGIGNAQNQRAGIWSISVDNDKTVKLSFDSEVASGKYFKILKGETYSGKSLRLSTMPESGKTELAYYAINENQTVTTTIFDGGSTRFYEYRDLYIDPNRSDKYVIYPKLGVFK